MVAKQLEPAVQFGRYTLVEELGRGAMGAVYLATHGALRKKVALKVLHPHIAENANIRERFKREGIAAAILDHPNVVNALDAGEHEGVPFLVMEYLEGKTLGTLLQERRAAGTWLSPEEALAYLLPVMEGVAFAHEKGVLHRDLKPENIFLSELRNGRTEPKVLDFGIARVRTEVAEHTLTAEGSLLGTPAYMSPEQVEDTKRVDARSDQFALAAVLYECVTGHRPVEVPQGSTLQSTLNTIAAAVVTPPRVWNPSLPEAFAAAILRGLARERDDRYPSVRAMMDALRQTMAMTEQRPIMTTAPAVVSPSNAPDIHPPTLPMAPPGQTLAASPREIAVHRADAPQRRASTLVAAALALVGVAGGTAAVLHRPAALSTTAASSATSATLAAPTSSPAPRPAPAPAPPAPPAPPSTPALTPASALAPTARPPTRDTLAVTARVDRRARPPTRRPRGQRAPTIGETAAPSMPPPRTVPLCGGVPCPD